MTVEQAKYHLQTLPMRQRMLLAMLRETHHTIDGIRAIKNELAANFRTIERAKQVAPTA